MNISILSCHNQKEAQKLMRELGVDPTGIEIMTPKTVVHLVRIRRLPIFAAHILKQEALSLGADTAVSREAMTGKIKHTDCIIIGTLLHFKKLCEKLKRQPYKLSQVSVELQKALTYYHYDGFVLEAGRYRLNLNSHTHIMGIVNLTPDSFSGDGLFTSPRHPRRFGRGRHVTTSPDLNYITDYAQKLVDEGADILDLGAESSRPGAKPVRVKEELRRLIPVLKKVRKRVNVPLSIDTCKSEVASQALANGADIINDITALSADSQMAKVIKRHKAAVVLMHMKGKPRTMQVEPVYHNVMEEITGYLQNAIMACLSAGIDFEKIMVDPGIGFGKTIEHTIVILKSLSELKCLGRPIVIGTSRKSFIGKLTGSPVSERLAGTISSNCFAVTNGARIVRVHDVKETKKAMAVLDTLMRC